MASFARSFKPSSVLLSPRRRPGVPGRTLSSSSDLSLTPSSIAAHQTDYFVDQPATSAPGTPCLSPAAGPAPEELSQSAHASPESTSNSPRAKNSSSNPIAIELPKLKKLSSGPFSTPPEPLSARGELKGGYFPLHEGPKSRVHRAHPFLQETAHSQQARGPDSITMQAERARNPHSARMASLSNTSTPVSSYIAPGFHDAPLPLGKYYPTNYEQLNPAPAPKSPRPAPAVDVVPSSMKPDSQLPRSRPETGRGDNPQLEMRRRMQQYQRDMIAQAAMGLDRTTSSPGVALNGLPIKETWNAGSATHRPLSPKLHPLGSPGPVTPMELEANNSNYLDPALKLTSPLALGELKVSSADRTPNSL